MCLQFSSFKMNNSRAKKMLNLVFSPGNDCPVNLSGIDDSFRENEKLNPVRMTEDILPEPYTPCMPTYEKLYPVQMTEDILPEPYTPCMPTYEKLSPVQMTEDILPEPYTPCMATYTELRSCTPIYNILQFNTIDKPSSSITNTDMPSNAHAQVETPIFDITTYYSDESYISGSDDNTLVNKKQCKQQSQVEYLLPTDKITAVDHSQSDVDQDINDKKYPDSDETYMPDSDESHNTGCKKQHQNHLIISESSSDSEDNGPESREKRATRKRVRRPETWKCNIKRKEVLSGKIHTSKYGKLVPAKILKDSCSCRKKCYEKVSEENRKNIFKLFWDENKTWEQKRQFILTGVKEKVTERRRIRSEDGIPRKKRDKTRLYNFTVDSKSIEVCQKFFLNTLGVSVTFVTNALKKSDHGMSLEDKRGKKNPPNKIKEELKNKIRKHIEEFPKYESHYSREKTKREYLGSHLTIEKLYSLYVETCKTNGEEIAKIWLYRHIFNTEYNIGFKPPQTDTCDDCDRYEIQIKDAQGEDLEELKLKRQKHLEVASSRYKRKAEDKENSMQSMSEKILTVDLQKCLPTPLLTNGQTFYLRKLWTLNYTILDSTANKCTCVMWDESKAGRGGNELASGLLKWFMENVAESPNVKKVVIWSDNCAGQNKNMHLFTSYLWLLKNIPHLDVIEHKYLLKGHTHMEVDGIHSLIERHKNKQRQFSIATPWDWQQVVRSCSTTKLPINVINMEVEDFKNFGQLHDSRLSPFINRKKGLNGQNVLYMDMVWIRMDKNEYGMLQYKTTFQDEAFKKVSLLRNQRAPCSSIPMPPPVRNNLNKISTKKFEDLQKTLTWVPQIFHTFYKNLLHDDNQQELDI